MVSCSQCCYKVPNLQNFNFPLPKKRKRKHPHQSSPHPPHTPPFFGTPSNGNAIKSTAQLKRLQKRKRKNTAQRSLRALDLTSRVLWKLTWRRRLSVKRRRQPKSLQHLDFGIWIAGPQTVGNWRRLDRDLNHGSRNGWKLTPLLQHVE
jgi:hypothetical protein